MPAMTIIKSPTDHGERIYRLIAAAPIVRNDWGMNRLLCAAALLLFACGDRTENEIRANVTLLVHHEGVEVNQAATRLEKFGVRAIPTIEAAMHTAPVAGRKNLILALRRIGDAEAVPLLRHRALFDPAPDVRREAEWTLKQWAAGEGDRAAKAKAALRAIDEARSAEQPG